MIDLLLTIATGHVKLLTTVELAAPIWCFEYHRLAVGKHESVSAFLLAYATLILKDHSEVFKTIWDSKKYCLGCT